MNKILFKALLSGVVLECKPHGDCPVVTADGNHLSNLAAGSTNLGGQHGLRYATLEEVGNVFVATRLHAADDEKATEEQKQAGRSEKVARELFRSSVWVEPAPVQEDAEKKSARAKKSEPPASEPPKELPPVSDAPKS